MRILYLSMSFDEQRDDIYSNLVAELVNRNHYITIVRSAPKINKSILRNISDNLRILDVKTGDPFTKNLFKKGLNQITLNRYFIKEIKTQLTADRFDLILYATPPITLYKSIKCCKEKYNAKTFLMLKDIFPQNAVDLEMFSKTSLVHKYFRAEEKRYYNISDCIGCMSQGNIDYIKEKNVYLKNKKIVLFPNSIKIDDNHHTVFNEDYTTFVFGGNLGKPQNLLLILNVFKKLLDYKKAKFIIVGSGTEEENIKKYINDNCLNNVQFLDFLPYKEYEKIVLESDVGLISLDPRFTIPNIPSKFQSYLKQHKPVLAITDLNTDLKNMIQINKCGWWCDASNEAEIIENIKYICEHKKQQIEYGENGYNYLKEAFDVKKNVDILESLYCTNK